MEYFPWFAWIAIAGIAAFAVTQVATQLARRRSEPSDDQLMQAIRETRDSNQALRARLEQLDGRLSAVERGTSGRNVPL
ncbi:thiosulfate reductase cytochrome b subunit [Arthrobacter sp. CAN_A212]|uniref:hypothetical protein n=1 Tax=unclassified Arthrobacter TaxID=235627 RepID=UPI0018C8E029|nr:hypothetical protein [Arthrobacter sp. CAN_C5]MBP2217998.1 thiosulfate reductase cytochrome b subunit [Arthrobacter sp. CAN_C5]